MEYVGCAIDPSMETISANETDIAGTEKASMEQLDIAGKKLICYQFTGWLNMYKSPGRIYWKALVSYM